MRVAACQLGTDQDRMGNRQRAVKAATEAADGGAELIVLPEATMANFGDPESDLSRLAEPLDGLFVEALWSVARSARVTIVAGMFEPVPRSHLVYNTAVVIGERGLLGSYRKLHLYDSLGFRESDRIQAGDPFGDGTLTHSVGDQVLGVMTCYDLRFPEIGRALVDRGATLLVVPAAWQNGPGKGEQWSVLLQARAMENCAYVVAAGQPEPMCCGLSMVIDPRGHVMASLNELDEATVMSDTSIAHVQEVRAILPLLDSRRFEVRPTR